MKLREQIEKGEIILNPYPSLIDYHGNYEQINLCNRKKGVNIFVNKYTRSTKDFTLPDEYVIEGDIPLKTANLQFYTDIEMLRGCKIEYTHEHGEWIDYHPKCRYYTEADFVEGLSKLWDIVNR